jgi:AraC-like DNA-binding protein
MSHYRPLFRSELVSIDEHSCRAPRTHGWSAEQGGEEPFLLLIRRGCFAVRGRIEVMADTFSALIYDGMHGYRVHRPADGGDAITRIVPGPVLMDEALGRSSIHVRITPEIHLRHMRLYARARAASAAALDIEEAAADLLHAVSAQSQGFDEISIPAATRRRIAEAKAFIAAAPEADHRLSDVAGIAGCSPYHFARLFKQETGCSLRAYRLKLRLAMAMHALAEGADDLTTLAMDSGFSHHSHMTATFRRALGESPSMVREALTAPRTFLKAGMLRAA